MCDNIYESLGAFSTRDSATSQLTNTVSRTTYRLPPPQLIEEQCVASLISLPGCKSEAADSVTSKAKLELYTSIQSAL